MKKVPIVLLILGGVLADFIGMVGCICMSILLFDIWSISCVLPLVIGGHVTGAVFLQRLYQRRWQIGKAIFWLCAGLPSARGCGRRAVRCLPVRRGIPLPD